ncbi:MAG: type II secretion system minor pseudopilin GspJ [Halioglobus sp.]
MARRRAHAPRAKSTVASARTVRARGFTLIEVLIAMAITTFVAVIAYTSLASALASVDQLRASANRTSEINRAWMILSRDLAEFVPRPVRDEFGEVEPALLGGEAARFLLSFTRTGWHNPNAHPRSNLQRVNYRLEDGALWRDSYVVLDRAGDSEPQSAKLLSDVEYVELAFLPSLAQIQGQPGEFSLDTRNWQENWVGDTSEPGNLPAPPVAVEVRLQLSDWGEMRRLYALPPL